MAVLGEDLFWTTSKSLKLYWTPIHSFVGTKSMLIEQPPFSVVPDTIILQSITPPTVSTHPCTIDNGGCSHICIALGPSTHSCLCPTEMLFKDSNNHTCIKSEECDFRCGSGECITKQQRCNNHKDCIDNSDEENCNNKKIAHQTCTFEEFSCADGSKCLPRSLRCDQNYDCDDKSDELDCGHYDQETKCHKMQHVCPNGKCIDVTELCDGVEDCNDGSDEHNCNNGKSTCKPDMFRCSSGQCISNKWVCDGAEDCADKSDELHCCKCIANNLIIDV